MNANFLVAQLIVVFVIFITVKGRLGVYLDMMNYQPSSGAAAQPAPSQDGAGGSQAPGGSSAPSAPLLGNGGWFKGIGDWFKSVPGFNFN